MTDEAKMTTTDGRDPEQVRTEQLNEGNKLHKSYIILTEEERAKGFVRPVRRSYIHVGRPGPRSPLRDLTPDERERYDKYSYVKFEPYPPELQKGTGRFWTQEMLDRVGKGCQTTTTMGQSIAETYARDPKFYGSTYCCGCSTHHRVGEDGEFVWLDAPDERVGT